jgi:DNA polymerase
MVLVAEPERDDTTELLSGPHGRLLAAMLAAMGIAPDAAYVGSVLPRHTPHADWDEAAARGLGDLACHHVALVAPQRLIVFGSSILSLLGHDPANFPAGAGEFQHGGSTLPMLAARDLAVLLERPRWKAVFWQNWLDWTKST